ncbi:hypothetical protein EKO23_06815 [Nocardioides guangzhouensis]|uniref:Peptidase C14 caspase domain-containing protein n=1 Tax=Nocardioides guangzhouensis TaxID=2497878 RepID=A0A4Q4ZGJ0_9ACTN|nr:caspase family protein [Nocardioides guangzhouensis]RYP87302.1 hypothetical protein EKO23_06815 [Nocardioides guangzhouensis]
MTTVHEVAGAGPGTHALVIGVGSYDHLLGGSHTLLDNPYGLGQLGSPSISALSVAEWLLNELYNPAAPLASLELLISAPTPAVVATPNGPMTIEPATMTNIANAASRWFARADAHAENVAVFYHCGHGLESADLALLAQDFGAPGGAPIRPWEFAYNFHRTYRGMAQCKARGQFYFIDACRQVSADVLSFDGRDLQVLVAPKLRGSNLRSAPILYASARESRAFAQTDGVSRFTEALLAALSSNGTERRGGIWRVSSEILGRAVLARIQLGNLPGIPEQLCVVDGESAGPVTLHSLNGNPQIPVHVRAATAPPTTSLEFRRSGETVSGTTLVGPPPWRHDVPAGTYTIVARDGAATIADLGEDWILPPVYERELT